MTASFPAKLKKLGRILFVMAGGFLILLILGEFALRFLGYGNLEVYDPDPELFWRLKPNQNCQTKIGRFPVHVNQFGYRGKSFSELKPAATKRVFTFGDSATYGWGIKDDETYSQQVENLLKADGISVEVINGGVNGYSLFQEEIASQRSLKFSPDAVIFAFCFNETWHGLETLSPEGRKRVLSAVAWKNYLRKSALFHVFGEIQMRFVYDVLRHRLTTETHGGKADDILTRVERYQRTLERIKQHCDESKIPYAFLILPIQGSSQLDAFQKTMSDFSEKQKIPLTSLVPLKVKEVEYFLQNDTVHPTAKGHLEIATHLKPVIQKLINN
jgi:lysophospholipase L1-like esterase